MQMRIGIVADDLTGAADTAVAFLSAPMASCVRFVGDDIEAQLASVTAGAVAVDVETRGGDEAAAGAAVVAVTETLKRAGFDLLYKKIDSLLRGHVAREVTAAIAAWAPQSIAIVAPAFPAVGRTMVGGRVRVDGQEAATAPAPAALFGAPTQTCALDQIRAADFGDRIRAVAPGGLAICDAETDNDLDGIVRAGLAAGGSIVWVGSGGLAHALARQLRSAPQQTRRQPEHVRGPILTVVGSLTSVAGAQARRLVAEGVTHVRVSPHEVAGMALPLRVGAALDRYDDVLVTIDAPQAASGDGDRSLVTQLGRALAPLVVGRVGGLVLTGGDTAIGMLRALECTGLDLVSEIEPGVVLSTSAGSRAWPVISKSGSFGDASTLARAVRFLRGLRE